jgi:Predicted membrane protein (DUF2232)
MTPSPATIFFYAAGAGLVSAVALVSSTTGSWPVRLTLLMISVLPIALVGFAVQSRAAILAASFACLFIGIASVPVGVRFALAFAYPVALLVYLTLLHRRVDEDHAQWYPIGRVILAACAMAGVLVAASFALLWQDLGQLREVLTKALDPLIEKGLVGLPGGAVLDDAAKANLVDVGLLLMPSLLVGFWLAMLLFNVWAAAGVARMSGQLTRPWPDLTAISYPPGTPLLLALSLGCALILEGIPQLMALSLSGAFYLAYVLLGLAIIHNMTRGAPWRQPALSALYVLLVAMASVVTVPLVLLGLVDSFKPFRRIDADIATPPPPPDAPS